MISAFEVQASKEDWQLLKVFVTDKEQFGQIATMGIDVIKSGPGYLKVSGYWSAVFSAEKNGF